MTLAFPPGRRASFSNKLNLMSQDWDFLRSLERQRPHEVILGGPAAHTAQDDQAIASSPSQPMAEFGFLYVVFPLQMSCFPLDF